MMNLSRLKSLSIAIWVFALSACGGGSGGGVGVVTPVTSNSTFQLKTALISISNAPINLPFAVSGTLNSVPITGKGTLTAGSLQNSFFEGKSALSRVGVVSMNLLANGQTIPLSVNTTGYSDSNYLPLGLSGSEYQVVIGQPVIPITAKVNDAGIAYVSNRYYSTSKSTLLGTVERVWVLMPDTENTALLKITDTSKDPLGKMTAQAIETWRITPAGGVTIVGETAIDIATKSNLEISYSENFIPALTIDVIPVVYQLKTALENLIKTPVSMPFSVSGTLNNLSANGQGTVTAGSLQNSFFEGKSALQRVGVVSMNLLVNGQNFPFSATTTGYSDTNYLPLGISGSEYQVVIGQPIIPITAKINDTGIAFISNRYSSENKSVPLGTVERSWVLMPDTGSMALLKITDTSKNQSGIVTAQSTSTLRITPAGAVTMVGETLIDIAGNSNLNIVY